MFKFLLYTFLFYVIFRYVFGNLLGAKTINYNQHNHYHNRPSDNEEQGRVTVDPKVNPKKKTESEKLGEYVDFEEVKE